MCSNMCALEFKVYVAPCGYWRVNEASETLSGVYKFELMWYMYVYIIHIYIGMEVHVP